MIDGEFIEITRALVGYVLSDATCPRCRRADRCEPWCMFRHQHASSDVDRLDRARVAIECYRREAGLLPA